jgi:hypothetical protein
MPPSHVGAFDVAEVTQARPQPLTCGTLEGKAKKPDARRFRRLLRARRERPCHRGAEKRDEVAAFQLIELHSVPSQGRIAEYRIGEEQSAGYGIPTMGEFLPGFEASQWYGVGAPKNTPPQIIRGVRTLVQ